MKLSDHQHLCYCMNAFPLDSVESLFDFLPKFAVELRRSLTIPAHEPIALGLWFPEHAVACLTDDSKLRFQLKQMLTENNLYVPTLNAFPYGKFHGEAIKKRVYTPNWTTPERLAYTCKCVKLLAALLPSGMTGVISTLPAGYKSDMTISDIENAVHNFNAAADFILDGNYPVKLAIEPEPGCLLETAADFETFITKLSPKARNVIGLCHDTAHAEVMNAPLPNRLIPSVFKIQLSAALSIQGGIKKNQRFQPFRDPIYLHQTRIGDTFYHDIPDEFKTDEFPETQTAAVHYHLPLFSEDFAEGCRTLKNEASRIIKEFSGKKISVIFEIETYTWDVIPPSFLRQTRTASIADEYRWVLQQRCHTLEPL